MFYRNSLITITIFLFLLTGCKSKKPPVAKETVDIMEDTNILETPIEDKIKTKRSYKVYPDTVLKDTIWFIPSTKIAWNDSVEAKGYKAFIDVHIDTNDLIIDTIKTSLGGKIAVGYNHYYTVRFSRKGIPWFQAELNKKEHLEKLIGGTDFWLNSNLEVIQRLIYNKVYGKFVVEFNINPGYNYGPVYYIVIDTTGMINYTGTAGSWGGSGPDGVPFLTADNNSFVTCFEIFNFAKDTSLGIAEYASMAESKTYGTSSSYFHWLYAMRPINKNNFLLVFSREDEKPEFNAVILNTDTTIVGHFKYYGTMEEMDALLLFQHVDKLKKYFLYDMERETLIVINENKPYDIKEIPLQSMLKVEADTMSEKKYRQIKFELFGKYTFYSSPNDSIIYYNFNGLN